MGQIIALLLVAGGCGGDGEVVEEENTYEETTGEEDVASEDTEASDEVAEEEDEEPRGVGPGRLTVKITVEGEEVAGDVRVEDAESGEEAGRGMAGQTFSVPAGDYRVYGHITDEDILRDRPDRAHDDVITIGPSQELTVSVEHGRARVRLNVSRNGRPVGNWRMELRRQGGEETVLELRGPYREHIPVSPGRYEGVVVTGNTRIDVTGIVFMGGATQDIPVRIQ